MKRKLFLRLIATMFCVLMAVGVQAQKQAEQLKRDAERIGQIHKIAIAPVVIQLRFDRDNRLPDPGRMAARQAAAMRIPATLESKMAGGQCTLLPSEAATLALKERDWQPTDLYVTTVKAAWDAPAEILRNKKGDEAVLLTGREEMKKTPDEMTLYRYKWHDLPDVSVGLAAFKEGNFAKIEIEKAKALAAKVGADAILFCQVADLDVHEGSTLFENFKSTRIFLHCTLIAGSDGAVLWQARARGTHSHKAGFFTGNRAYQAEEGMAVEGMTQALEFLLADLVHGTGKPVQ